MAFTGVLLTLRHARKLQDAKDANDERGKRVDVEREAIANLIVTIAPWVSSIADWGLAYRTAENWRQSPRVAARYETYEEAADQFSAALSIARVTVRNPSARASLDSLRDQRAIMTSVVMVAMIGKPREDFSERWTTCHKACGSAVAELEKAALNWDGTVSEPTDVIPSPSQNPTADFDVEETGSDNDKDGTAGAH